MLVPGAGVGLRGVHVVIGVALGFVGVCIASHFAKKELDKELGDGVGEVVVAAAAVPTGNATAATAGDV